VKTYSENIRGIKTYYNISAEFIPQALQYVNKKSCKTSRDIINIQNFCLLDNVKTGEVYFGGNNFIISEA
jgi:hypothetical protein